MSLSDKAYSEKRDFIRMTISAPLNARLSTEDAPTVAGVIEGQCKNLSGGGMLVLVNQELPLGTELDAEVASEHGHHPTLKARVRVVRSTSVEDNQFEVGLEIIEMKE
jgi:hypothetical protein